MTSPFDLDGPGFGPVAGGKPRQLVVLLHGLGADGNDLIDLAPLIGRILPHAAFIAPHAPFPCDMAPMGRQWFSLQDRTPAALLPRVRAAAAILDAFLDRALESRGLADDRLALFGFSQGCMLALHTAPRRPRPCAAVLGYSGALVGPEALAAEIRTRPPVLLVHGTADDVVPFGAMAAAKAGLEAAGIPVAAVPRPGLPHGIDPEGLQHGLAFLARTLATATDQPDGKRA